MSDRYRDSADPGVGSPPVGRLGLPRPAVLRRHEPGAPASVVTEMTARMPFGTREIGSRVCGQCLLGA